MIAIWVVKVLLTTMPLTVYNYSNLNLDVDNRAKRDLLQTQIVMSRTRSTRDNMHGTIHDTTQHRILEPWLNKINRVRQCYISVQISQTVP